MSNGEVGVTGFQKIPASKRSISLRRLIHGVGINDADYQTRYRSGSITIQCPFYVRWTSMIQRCYSSIFHKKNPTYKGCSVCDEWLVFSNFRLWMEGKDWSGKHIDKDILISGNKVYSPDACIFVTRKINNLILDHLKGRGISAIGVSFNSKSKRFVANCRIYGKQVFLGQYCSEEEASAAYREAKSGHVRELARMESEPLRSRLNEIANEITRD